MKITIAIDGPAGSGKSTIAKLVASEMNITYLDTGAMYRAITLKALRAGIPFIESPAFEQLLETTQLDLNKTVVYMDGEDITEAIRSLEVTKAVSEVASLPMVRESLVILQREIAAGKSIVMDGRDIGSRVLPHADLKIFLTASPDVRGKRRWLELKQKGEEADLNDIVLDIQRRDDMDQTRAHSPLICPEDAIIIDTSNLSIVQVKETIIGLVKNMEKAGQLH